MPRGAIALTIFFFLVAGWQATGGFGSDEQPAAPPVVDMTPDVAPVEPSPSVTELAPLPRVQGPPPRAKTYATIEELAADLEEKGLACTSLQHLEQPDPTLQDFALCDMGDPSRRVDIYLFPSPANRDLWLPGMKKIDLVFGPNWILNGAGDPETIPQRLRSIRNAIGGKIRIR